jgi:hypothetical protein
MAEMNEQGNILACCPGCEGAKTAFVWSDGGAPLSAPLRWREAYYYKEKLPTEFRLYKCSSCGFGALVRLQFRGGSTAMSAEFRKLIYFTPEAKPRHKLPKDLPQGIVNEFREAELAFEQRCNRAAAALLRSALDKAMFASGLRKTDKENLEAQINRAADFKVIHEARRLNAHKAVRTLGNDVLHQDWRAVEDEEIEDARHYVSRVLDDLYDERAAVLKMLRDNNCTPEEDRPKQT